MSSSKKNADLKDKFASFVSENKNSIIAAVGIVSLVYLGYVLMSRSDVEDPMEDGGHSLLDVMDTLHDNMLLPESDIKAMWKTFDKDGSDTLEFEEVKDLLVHLWQAQLDWTEKQCKLTESALRKSLQAKKMSEHEIHKTLDHMRTVTTDKIKEKLKNAKEDVKTVEFFFEALDLDHDKVITKEGT